mmetsp:Transcript_28512/g.73459  ORF Transcript_28512/g.73459 Transcript_28512/m.73459 type:complete len:290 (+) Transcript_28512:333-1202(+)
MVRQDGFVEQKHHCIVAAAAAAAPTAAERHGPLPRWGAAAALRWAAGVAGHLQMGLASRCASVALSTGSVARPPLCHLALFSHQLHWGWRGTEGSGCQGCLGGWGCQAEMWATCAAAPPAAAAGPSSPGGSLQTLRQPPLRNHLVQAAEVLLALLLPSLSSLHYLQGLWGRNPSELAWGWRAREHHWDPAEPQHSRSILCELSPPCACPLGGSCEVRRQASMWAWLRASGRVICAAAADVAVADGWPHLGQLLPRRYLMAVHGVLHSQMTWPLQAWHWTWQRPSKTWAR